jgi:hypothetical protein
LFGVSLQNQHDLFVAGTKVVSIEEEVALRASSVSVVVEAADGFVIAYLVFSAGGIFSQSGGFFQRSRLYLHLSPFLPSVDET